MIRTLVLALCLALPSAASAQQMFQTLAADSVRARAAPIIRAGKWTSAGVAVAAAAGGILWNRQADRRYEDLELLCTNSPARCSGRASNGAFLDAQLEAEYQEILKLDDRARLALITGEVAIAATIVLFILDLPRDNAIADKPYSPPKLRVWPGRSGLELTYRIR